MFEIQIQTALEHAWVTATHDVVYKSDKLDWQKLRLAAQIKAQIEVVDLIFRNFEQVASSMESREWRDGVQVEKITNLFDSLIEQKVIPSEKMPRDKIRLAQNAIRLLSKSSLGDIDNTIEKIGNCFNDIGREGFPQNLTLIQVFMLAATRTGCQSNADRRFTPHITDSLIKMFPELKSWNVLFGYNEI